MTEEQIRIEPIWRKQLLPEFQKPYMSELRQFLKNEYQKKRVIYPEGADYFAAFNYTPFDQTKVVILGQDPYHGPGQAHGLCFSVRPGVRFPPSLQNIFKEIKSDVGGEIPNHGCLIPWAMQGVLLLNSVLTVEKGKAASHQKRGWEDFTDHAIKVLSEEKENLVFILWGSYAQKKGAMIDRFKHLVIESPHPSPLSSHRGFFGSKPFSQTNAYLKKHGKEEVHWSLPPMDEILGYLN